MVTGLKTEFRSLRLYVMVALGLLIGGVVLGYRFIDIPLNLIRSLADPVRVFGENNQPWRIFAYILQHNALSTLVNVVGGYIAIFSLLSNGVLIGTVIKFLLPHVSPSCLSASLVPHGIIEIPIVLLSAALGMAFATLLMKTYIRAPRKLYLLANPADLLSLFTTNHRIRERGRKTALIYLFFIVPALILAALIETFLTPLVMRSFCSI